MKNYYRILQITAEASREEIKRAYYRLAKKYHPDVNPGNKVLENFFKQIMEAYTVLYSAEEREKYDVKLQRYEQLQKKVRKKQEQHYNTTIEPAQMRKGDVARVHKNGEAFNIFDMRSLYKNDCWTKFGSDEDWLIDSHIEQLSFQQLARIKYRRNLKGKPLPKKFYK
jgi:DnaJ-class molecular chaperone